MDISSNTISEIQDLIWLSLILIFPILYITSFSIILVSSILKGGILRTAAYAFFVAAVSYIAAIIFVSFLIIQDDLSLGFFGDFILFAFVIYILATCILIYYSLRKKLEYKRKYILVFFINNLFLFILFFLLAVFFFSEPYH